MNSEAREKQARAPVELVIITGLSGAGKSEAIRGFEDMGFFCVDNLPPALISKFAELCAHSDGRVSRAAVVTDVRGGAFFDDLSAALSELERMGFNYRILFLTASDETLVRRYKETRRRHPLAAGDRTLLESIRQERARLAAVQERADKVIDTSDLPVQQFKGEVSSLFRHAGVGQMVASVISFGYKYGIPLDADVVLDLRFLPNPHWVEDLRPLPGTDPRVCDFVLSAPGAREFLEHLFQFLDFVLPRYGQEGKAYLTIALGCTGGRHRSVVVAQELAAHLEAGGYRTVVEHRDVAK